MPSPPPVTRPTPSQSIGANLLALTNPSFRWLRPQPMSCLMMMGSGAVQSISKKQKVNTRSLTEAELVATDDVIAQIVWTRNFLEAQGVKVDTNIVYQDNQRAMLLEKNGRSSAGKRSRHLDIRYFFITDQVNQGNLEITYCPTDVMTADYMTKPLHGQKFHKFKKEIMNIHI